MKNPAQKSRLFCCVQMPQSIRLEENNFDHCKKRQKKKINILSLQTSLFPSRSSISFNVSRHVRSDIVFIPPFSFWFPSLSAHRKWVKISKSFGENPFFFFKDWRELTRHVRKHTHTYKQRRRLFICIIHSMRIWLVGKTLWSFFLRVVLCLLIRSPSPLSLYHHFVLPTDDCVSSFSCSLSLSLFLFDIIWYILLYIYRLYTSIEIPPGHTRTHLSICFFFLSLLSLSQIFHLKP